MTSKIEKHGVPFYRRKWVVGLLAFFLLLFTAYKALPFYLSYKMGDVETFASEIAAFEASDRENPPALGQVLFIGSSSIRLWDSLQSDMQPFSVINRGFGGSMLHHSTHFADRIVTPYQPSAIVMYAGGNDIGNLIHPRTAEQVSMDFEEFVAKVRTDVGDMPIIYIAIKPSKLRQKQWPEMQKANAIISARAQQDPLLYFADIATPMLDDDGNSNRDYLIWDGLHLNEKGYALWTSIVRPLLIEILDDGQDNEEKQAQ